MSYGPDKKSILVMGCFDTKSEAFAYLRSCILALGEEVITINTGVLGTTEDFPVDFESDQVAQEVGYRITDLREKRDRGHAMDVMGVGAAKIVGKLVNDGLVKGAIGMGGGGGTYIALSAMQEIPLGIPKLCLSTLATKDLTRQIGHKDITLMPSVVDVAGLNSILKVLIKQAAGAIGAMAGSAALSGLSPRGNIAISMFGNTTPCVDQCTELLKKRGYEVLAFHANGVGGKAMEALISEGCFEAVLDITTTELADHLCDGICSAGPDRLTAASEKGIPQVIVPGCLDMVNFGHLDTVPQHYKNRKLYSWAPDVTLMRTNAVENEILGKELAEKVNASGGPVSIILPKNGISQVDQVGSIFYDPESDDALFESIKKHAGEHVTVMECEMHINDAAFADLLVNKLLELIINTHKS
ncbi:Tm-1-like ATP-binding domain-containing protein [Dyadobacter sp. CY323]|uniref:Tm-1-like ATP-binding domain-containing protein n=1 Tax=Dyadobacter sp. CY323 TaxID=2907302 RepID=UPI001F451B5B|nr:Tm-1-like ATP-binding domain-containing protein [Dyadobacter sp. CY323]MCE6991037.1 Tm-1-like ATP-binding domain-containing protein [Dyadobacter sp. CY323]